MASPSSPPGDPLAFTGLPPRPDAPPQPVRNPLGWPAGSVRAVITLIVVALVWVQIVLSREQAVTVPLYLYYLMFLSVGSFFAAHGHSIAGHKSDGPSPLHLPRGSMRLLIVLGFLAAVGWHYYRQHELPEFRVDPLEQPYLPLFVLGGFFLGALMARVVGHTQAGLAGRAYWFQDIQAWVALLAVAGLAVEVIIHTVINPSLTEVPWINLPSWQAFLAAIVSFYFGARS
jgi:hypothetical protein